VKYEPLNPAFRADPYPTYAWLREHDPIHMAEERGIRVLSRYHDIAKVLRAPDVSRNVDESAIDLSPAELLERDARMARSVPKSLLQLDAPDHTRLRSLVSKAFTPRAVDRLRPRVQQLVDDALTVVEETGRIELIDAMAFPVPFAVISDLLDMPTERSDELRDWAQAITLSLESSATTDDLVAAQAAVQSVIGFLVPVIEERRRNLGDDVLSALIAVEEDGERLSLPELISTVVLLYIAGHETTVNLIGNSALALAKSPDQRALWRERGPSYRNNSSTALESSDGPVQQTIRVPTVDMEVSGGVLPAGHRVLTLLGSANRDASVFERADELRLDREGAARQVAFAQGVHYCLGAALARLEGQVALGTMVRRYEDWELAAEPHWRDRLTIRGVDRLELTLGRRS
jgi:cytochrome P450